MRSVAILRPTVWTLITMAMTLAVSDGYAKQSTETGVAKEGVELSDGQIENIVRRFGTREAFQRTKRIGRWFGKSSIRGPAAGT